MNRIWCTALVIVMLLNAAKTYSQAPGKNKNINPGTISIAVSPLTIFDYEPTVNLQLMYKFNNRYSAAIEVGRIIKPLGKNEENLVSFNQFTGWRFRPEIRFMKQASNSNNWAAYYFAIQGLIKIAEEQLYYNAYRSTPSGLSYMEAIEQNINKTVLGLNGLIGKEAALFNSKKIFADMFTGVGLRYKFFKDNLGTDFSKASRWNFNKNGIYPTVSLGVRIGFKVN